MGRQLVAPLLALILACLLLNLHVLPAYAVVGTFGNENAEATTTDCHDAIRGTKFTNTAGAGTGIQISVYCSGGTGCTLKAALYAADGTGPIADGTTDTIEVPTGYAWRDLAFTVAPTIADETSYYIVMWADEACAIRYVTSGNVGAYDSETYGNPWPASLAVKTDTKVYSVHCDFTVEPEGQDLTFTLTGLTHLYASVNKDITLKFTKTGLIHTLASLGYHKELPFLLTGTVHLFGSLQKSLEVSRLLTGLVRVYGSLGVAFEMGAQNLIFTLSQTILPYASLGRGIGTAHTLTQTVWFYSALRSGKGIIVVLSQSVYILASMGVAKELIRILPGLVQVWHTLETQTQGVAIDLLVTLFEAVNVWGSLAADLSEVAEAALTIDDAYAIGALGLILALVAIALIVIHRRA